MNQSKILYIFQIFFFNGLWQIDSDTILNCMNHALIKHTKNRGFMFNLMLTLWLDCNIHSHSKFSVVLQYLVCFGHFFLLFYICTHGFKKSNQTCFNWDLNNLVNGRGLKTHFSLSTTLSYYRTNNFVVVHGLNSWYKLMFDEIG